MLNDFTNFVSKGLSLELSAKNGVANSDKEVIFCGSVSTMSSCYNVLVTNNRSPTSLVVEFWSIE